MPTNFIAVRCFQCWTMQVKQQKKSSNKWSCAVCNQKQSVCKVFAQSLMARDVRKFVQASNMSRLQLDQMQPVPEEIETLENQETTKRSDWSEYVDVDEHSTKFDSLKGDDDGLEPLVVTEMPKQLFKKPRLKDSYCNRYGSAKMFKPVFSNGRNAKRHPDDNSQDAQSTPQINEASREIASGKCEEMNRTTKWNLFKAQIQENNRDKIEEIFTRQPKKAAAKGPISKWTEESKNNEEIETSMARARHPVATSKGPVSKWSSFITKEEEDDDDDDDDDSRGNGRICFSKHSSYALQKLMDNNERVEDDVHPDFIM